MMTLERLARLADAYGGRPGRWPQAEREAAQALCRRDPWALRLLEEAEGLDNLLDAAPHPEVTSALRERVLASVPRGLVGEGRHRRSGMLAWLSGMGWVAAAFAGVAFGLSLTWQATADLQTDAIFFQAGLDATDDTEVLGG